MEDYAPIAHSQYNGCWWLCEVQSYGSYGITYFA